MPLKVAPTPILTGKDAVAFLERVTQDLKIPATYKETPKLDQVKALVRLKADKGKG